MEYVDNSYHFSSSFSEPLILWNALNIQMGTVLLALKIQSHPFPSGCCPDTPEAEIPRYLMTIWYFMLKMCVFSFDF